MTLSFTTAAEWRSWLHDHHDRATEVWLIYTKQTSEIPCIGYEESVEEALCYGWIDSIIRKIDERRYARKFTPRKPKSVWSDLNRRRVAKLIKEGRMTDIGLAKVSFHTEEDVEPEPSKRIQLKLNDELEQVLRANQLAWENFQKLAPSYRRNYVNWIMSAKQHPTRLRRLQEAVSLLEKNQKLGLK